MITLEIITLLDRTKHWITNALMMFIIAVWRLDMLYVIAR